MDRGACNICGSTRYSTLLDLGKHPLADTFLPPALYDAAESYYPLALAECEDCAHVFTRFHIPPSQRYIVNDYSYDSSNSPVAEAHFKEFSQSIVQTYQDLFGRRPVLAIDIGSNVGTLLGYMKDDFDVNVLGVEPAANIAALAAERGIPTICALFDRDLQGHAQFSQSNVDIVTSTNVVNHMDDLHQMMEVISGITTPQALFAFEVPYLIDILEKKSFDTVYHEHVNYFSLRAAYKLLEPYGFRPRKIERIDYMGGSIRVFAARIDAAPDDTGGTEMATLLAEEAAYFAKRPDWRDELRKDVLKIKQRLLAFIHGARINGSTFCCIGAATKGNTLLNYCRLDKNAIAACGDVSSLKVGKIMPGSGIPIVHDKDLGNSWDYAIVLPWNLSGYLIEKFRKSGLALVFPISGEIINQDGTRDNLA